MFSTSTAPPGSGDGEGGNEDGAGVGDGESSQPWGAGGPGGGTPGKGGGNWQGSSSLSWLTNLRKGIMNGGKETVEAVECVVCFRKRSPFSFILYI